MDVCCVLLPLFVVRTIQITGREKVGLMFILSLGLL